MLKFKKGFENQTIVLADGTLVNSQTISTPHVQKRLSGAPWFAYMLDEEAPKVEAAQVEEPKAKEPKKRTRAK